MFGSAAASLGQDGPAQDKLSTTDKEKSGAARSHDLDVRYAEVLQQIAEVNLRKALDTNRQVPGTISDPDVQRLREQLRLAQQDTEKLKQASSTGNDDRLREAKARANLAEAELRKARQANRRTSGTVPAIEMERLQLEHQAAQLNVARQQAASDVPSALAEMREQIQELRGEVARLRRELTRVGRTANQSEVQTGTRSGE
jgi:hypothetical protein